MALITAVSWQRVCTYVCSSKNSCWKRVMCSEHEDLVWEHRSTLYQLFSRSVLCLSLSLSLIISCHWLLDWYPAGFFSFSPLFYLFSPPSSPFYLSGTLRDTEEDGRRRRETKKKKKTDGQRVRECEEMARKENMRLLSKNNSLSVSQPSILICMHKPTCWEMHGLRVYRHKHTHSKVSQRVSLLRLIFTAVDAPCDGKASGN